MPNREIFTNVQMAWMFMALFFFLQKKIFLNLFTFFFFQYEGVRPTKLYCICDLNHIFPNIFNAKYGILVLDTFRNDSNCVAKIKAIFCGDIFNAKCGILACTAVCYDVNCDFKISHRMQYIKIWCHQRELTSTFFQDKHIALQWPF